MKSLLCTVFAVVSIVFVDSRAQDVNNLAFDMGTPQFMIQYVNPATGSDDNIGSREKPLATVTAAWNKITPNVNLILGVKIVLQRGTYTNAHFPQYWENRWGTMQAPVIIESEEGASSVTISTGFNIANCNYIYLIGLTLNAPDATADVVHIDHCKTVLLRNCTLQGNRTTTQECLKVNQSQYLYIEHCDISGAWDNAVDMVAVQFGHIKNNKIHNSGDWTFYTKGGSGYLAINGNEFYDGGTGGYTAGQGTGFQFMSVPWLHYEAYDCKIVNNIVHDCEGAAFGVNGGYNILIAHNTAYRCGKRSHVFEAVFGSRSCDGQPGSDFDTCGVYLTYGGWGNSRIADGDNYTRIPNKNVFVYNNIFYNPEGYQSEFQHFTIAGKYSGDFQAGSNVTTPTLADDNLVFKGNIIWNGNESKPLGVGDENGCGVDNPTCNEEQIRKENSINTLQPDFTDAERGDFSPVAKGKIQTAKTFTIPDFTGKDRPAKPETVHGVYSNLFSRDFKNDFRDGNPVAGAIQNSPTTDVTDNNTQNNSNVVWYNNGMLHINSTIPTATRVTMYSINGNSVYSAMIQPNTTQLQLHHLGLSKGVYAFVLQSSTTVTSYLFAVTE
ncbi:MAG: right-handed parallel beta-helix repeat-containing protein [Candidatus Kapabacteria bacterium]|nr:right-handed parallel beta-helix repeat-containing protein [Candidatus Kapabacteria bacterium]